MNVGKKLRLALVLAVSIFVLTGCVRMNLDVKVKWNGKADVSFLYSVQGTMASVMDLGDKSPLDSLDPDQFREDGWTVKEYAADGYTGYLISKENVDLSSAGMPEGVKASLQREGLRYIMDVDLFSDDQFKQLATYAKVIQAGGGSCTVRLSLPLKAVNHNATSESNHGKTLEWDLLSLSTSEPLHTEVSLLIPVIIAAALVLLVLLLVVLLLIRRRPAPKVRKPSKGVRKL